MILDIFIMFLINQECLIKMGVEIEAKKTVLLLEEKVSKSN